MVLNRRRTSTTMAVRRSGVSFRWLLVLGAVLVTALLVNPSHGAVIKRENSISEQELVAEELLAAVKQSETTSEKLRDNEAIGDANRISETASNGTKESPSPEKVVDTDEEVATAEPFDAAGATDTPIPTFQPSIDRYTSAYRDDGVAESESLNTRDGGVFTTVDYEQRFDRIEMTTQENIKSSAEVNPKGMFPQESTRFDVQGVKLEEEVVAAQASTENIGQEEEEHATIVNLDALSKDNSTTELDNTKYETQVDEGKSNQTTGTGQKRGKYLQNSEEATVINSEINDANLSIPSTADVWALAAMKNIDHSQRRTVFVNPPEPERSPSPAKDTVNATSATKLLTDWMEIMKNNEFSNGSYLRNDIPSVGDKPTAPEDGEQEQENQRISVVVTPPTEMQSTISIRRFDESFETTTEPNIDRSIDVNYYPSAIGGTGVSDNLYYEDFTTDLPEDMATTVAPETDVETITGAVKEDQQSAAVMTATTTTTTETAPRNEINTVPPNDLSYDRKPTEEEAVKDVALESSSLSENIIPSTTEELNRNSGSLQSPTTPDTVIVTTTTTQVPPRIVPLTDAAVFMTTEKKELEHKNREGENKEPENHQQQESTAIPTDITNNSIATGGETKVVESNNLPEYTVVVEPTAVAGGGAAADATTNSNSNHLESINNTSGGGGSQSSADHEDGHGQQQLAHEHSTRPDYNNYHPMITTTTAVEESTMRVMPVNSEATAASGGGGGESGAAAATTDQSAAVVVPPQTFSSSTTTASTDVPETMVSETKTTIYSTTLSPERIEVEQRRTNGHQVIEAKNDTLELGGIAGGGGSAADAASSPEDGSDVNAIIAITVSVVAVIALVLLVGFLYVMRKRQKQLSYGQRCQPVGLDAYSLDNVSVYNSVRRKNNNLRLSKRSYGNSAFEDPGLKFNNLSIQGLQTMMANKSEIYEEFKEIPLITARVDEVPAGCEDKNRYANVVPLPETRVHLKQLNGDEKTEYINANYVRGPKDNVNYYIACQAPMENTIVDFWRMIWEQNSKVICMLTDLTENGIEKCAEYLPPSAVLDTNRVFGEYSVTLKNREVKDKYAVSTIHLRNTETNTWREITHFWYQWPEEGMPLDETSVIAMLLEVRSYLKMAMPEQTGGADDDNAAAATQDEKQKKIQELNDDLTEKLGEDVAGGGVEEEKKANGTIDKSKSLQRSQGPLTVHCSPGTGRTGTIIGCDIAIRSLEMKNRSVDVPQTVYYVRRGRASTIKTRDQYEFIYRCANTYAQKLMEPIAEN